MIKGIELILNLLYPWRCPFCGEISKEQICSACKPKLPYVEEPVCKRCGKPVRYSEREYCHDCASKNYSFEAGRSLWLHKGIVASSVYQFKYHNRRSYAACYAKEMTKKYQRQIRRWNIDVIIPIPISSERKRKRGYNQAFCLARDMGEMLGIPVDSKALRRVKRTVPQKELNPKVRAKNLKGAFCANGKYLPGKTVLLIDDIYTTGSTVEEASLTLKKAGVSKVYFLTISIGQGF